MNVVWGLRIISARPSKKLRVCLRQFIENSGKVDIEDGHQCYFLVGTRMARKGMLQ